MLQDWDKALEKQQQAWLKADAELAKTDRTTWFGRTRWPQHLANSNLRHLSQATHLSDREETVLQRAVELVDRLIERLVSGDDEIRRWLRSAKPHEPDTRPLSRLQHFETQAVYDGYMRRLVCYSMRVWKSLNEQGEGKREVGRHESQSEYFNESDGSDGSDDSIDCEDSDDSSDDSVNDGGNDTDNDGVSTAVFAVARRLFPVTRKSEGKDSVHMGDG